MVSVIVTTRNEEKNIENCLKSIKNQKYPEDKVELKEYNFVGSGYRRQIRQEGYKGESLLRPLKPSNAFLSPLTPSKKDERIRNHYYQMGGLLRIPSSVRSHCHGKYFLVGSSMTRYETDDEI